MSSSDEDINVVITPELIETLEKSGFLGGRKKPKCIRAITVCAYVLSVSMAAILLSVYYVFVWDGQQPRVGARKGEEVLKNDHPTALDNCNFTTSSADELLDNLQSTAIQQHHTTATELPEVLTTSSSTTTTTTDENSTFSADYDLRNQNLELDFDPNGSGFIKKLMSYRNNDDQQYPYEDDK